MVVETMLEIGGGVEAQFQLASSPASLSVFSPVFLRETLKTGREANSAAAPWRYVTT